MTDFFAYIAKLLYVQEVYFMSKRHAVCPRNIVYFKYEVFILIMDRTSEHTVYY